MFYIIKVALGSLLRIIDLLILIRVVLSFFPTLQTSKISYFIYQMTEPILAPFRSILDKLGLGMGMIDFSPILAIIFLNILQRLVYAI
ncbi:MAG: YggT family protein [Tissierellia bacterium]|jgi:YggT family protein|nr:YggT family protein [Tissierellia bacterium]MDD3751083.1 YggT family protein [Tissierellia bacterium]MDD4045952.1 YggT family protein [Tissierellia bacterium]MDD4678053.1 YggT family protein [Tissierellia bacterium]